MFGQETMSPPRLTGALRSFSSVSKKDEFTEHLYDLKVSRRCGLWSHGDFITYSVESNTYDFIIWVHNDV